jgi:hypothetical protein
MFGIDIHPDFQKGISIAQVAAEGFGFLSVKLSESTSNYWELSTPDRPGSAEWIRQGKAAGLVCLGYHYLQPAQIPTQAQVFADALSRCQVPGVIDAEAGYTKPDGSFVPTLTISHIRQFYSELLRRGANIAFLYLPHWYWQLIGEPDLNGLPPLWASSYPSTRQAPAWDLFQLVDPGRWAAYGGNVVGVLQFGSSGLVAGHVVDVNAWVGDQTGFARFIRSSQLTRRRSHMGYVIEPTPAPAEAKPDDRPTGDWVAREYTLTAPGPAGGWPGRLLMHWTPGWLGAFVQEAWCAPSGTHYVNRWDPVKKTGGKFVDAFVTQSWELPAGDKALILRLATRAYGSAIPETQN